MLIDQWGDDEGVLVALGGSIMSGVWSGSRKPFYEKLRKLALGLQLHSKEKVVQWANRLLNTTDAWIDREEREASARKVGRFYA
jgi:hypothetical protein